MSGLMGGFQYGLIGAAGQSFGRGDMVWITHRIIGWIRWLYELIRWLWVDGVGWFVGFGLWLWSSNRREHSPPPPSLIATPRSSAIAAVHVDDDNDDYDGSDDWTGAKDGDETALGEL
nr:hypothetical protein CFP56_31043 [Quercus suber]